MLKLNTKKDKKYNIVISALLGVYIVFALYALYENAEEALPSTVLLTVSAYPLLTLLFRKREELTPLEAITLTLIYVFIAFNILVTLSPSPMPLTIEIMEKTPALRYFLLIFPMGVFILSGVFYRAKSSKRNKHEKH